ncbi:restriction endonuclease subunit S [Aeromonas caviae]|uniref:restriction endonuclease subunit S n=1 Tax=Aeromonas caviae TaxID=648 RepID=UPI0038D0F10E
MSVIEHQAERVGKYQPYPEYNNSGYSWMAKIPSGWLNGPLKRIAYLQAGFAFKGDTFNTSEGVPIVRMNNILNSGGLSLDDAVRVPEIDVKPEFYLATGDIVMGMSGSIENIAKVQGDDLPCALNQRVGRFVLRAVDDGFLWYLIQSNGFKQQVSLAATGTAQLNISSDQVGNTLVSWPVSLLEQNIIAAFLDYETARIDRLIAQQQRLIELLKEKRQAVISHAVTKGLNPDVPMKDSGVEWLGQVPEHWVVGPIKYTLQSKKGACKAGPFGSHLTNADMTGSDVKVITQRNVIDDDMEVGDSYISSDKYKELRAFTIQKGDILVTTRGTIGRTALFQQEYTAILHPCLIRLQADGAILIPEWLSLLIQESGYVVEQILIKSNATTIEVIYSESLLNVDIAYPPSESEQIDVLDFINCQKMKFQHLISAAGRAISLMQERRTALISAAVTGKIDLRGWTPPAEEVAA